MNITKYFLQKTTECLQQSEKIIDDMQQLVEKMNSLECSQLTATCVFPNLDEVQQKQPQLVYIDLMVQDMRDSEYYYSYLIQKPLTKQSKVIPLKYGLSALDDQIMEKLQNQQYYPIMDSRQPITCITERYRSQWVGQWSNNLSVNKSVTLMAPANHQFKLGDQIKALAIWNPSTQNLYYIRPASEAQIMEKKLGFSNFCLKEEQKLKQNQFQQYRNKTLSYLKQYCQESFAHMLLYSLISPESIFLDGPNMCQIIKQIYPRVLNFKVKCPFPESFFPYKNEQGILIQTPMQFSNQKTFVILDFSELSEDKVIKINQAEIDNIKALKVFVEESQAVFRWQIGESLFPHCHSGIIFKASNIINPHYKMNMDEEKPKMTKKTFQKIFTEDSVTIISEQEERIVITEEDKHSIRVYLEQCKRKQPILNQEARKEIQKMLMKDCEENKESGRKLMIPNRLELAKINAMTMGRDQILVQDYMIAKQILKDVTV